MTVATKADQMFPVKLDKNMKKQGLMNDVVITINPKLWKFSGDYACAMTAFYDMKAKCRSWIEDRKWLEQDWRKIDSVVELFDVATNTAGLVPDAVRIRYQEVANDAISKFASSPLRTTFVTRSNTLWLGFDNIIGALCQGWLNDSAVDFCLEAIVGSIGQSLMLSTLLGVVGWPTSPKTQILYTKFIVHPVSLSANHWGLITVRLYCDVATKTLQVQVFMYEPLIDEEYQEQMIASGKEFCNTRERIIGYQVTISPVERIKTPQQPDAISCGVLVIAQAYSYLTESMRLQEHGVSKRDVGVMRLRMIWMVVSHSKERSNSVYDADKANRIRELLQKQLG
ncbi:hypothetical protein F442_06722 [Phytophthora nicotianae P10297]|uniref:Ubiquitin-like protease family profile domain-containing protein n=1 Tax=Phytophthora nicotianae P10297 TaxID=1317064 RepID=W2ZII6_PHYNI|nr:hypothetical protein F442_06722 [Phytophthora nicotianae P10297]